MDIRERDTVEVASPVQSRRRVLVRLITTLVSLAVLAAALALAISPELRSHLAMSRSRLVTLEIASTPPGADVFIDEQSAGATPTQARVSAGPHTIRIVRHGYEAWHEVVDARTTRQIAHTLVPLELATLLVESEPDRATVLLDDEYQGSSPIELTNVEAGAHVVRVVKDPLFEPVVEHVELKGGETRRLVVRLQSGLENLYLSRIKKEPTKLSNYTELLHLHVINNEGEKAMADITRAVDAFKSLQASPTEVRQFYDEIRKMLKGQAGKVSPADREKLLGSVLILFERLVLAAPAEYETYEPLASLLAQAGRFDDIVKVCEKTVAVPEAKGLVHLYVAKMYLNWGEPTPAIQLLERTIALRPDLFTARLSLGSAYHRADRYDDAMRQYEAAEKLAGQSSPYYQGLLQTQIARLLVSRKDINGAVARYKKALGFEVSSTYTCQWRLQFAELLIEHERKQEAVEQYREIVKSAPETQYGYAARRALRRLEGK